MNAYFIRRLLLVPVTMIGVTLLVFTITRLVPGGPLDRALQASAAGENNKGQGGKRSAGGMSEEQMEALEEEYGYDKPIVVAYLQWLGVLPRERLIAKEIFNKKSGREIIGQASVSDIETQTVVVAKGSGREVLVTRDGAEVLSANYVDDRSNALDEWSVRVELAEDRQERWMRRMRESDITKAPQNYEARVVLYRRGFSGLLQGDFGKSNTYGDPVIGMIARRVPIALYFGLISAFLTYLICIPLGVLKAIRHRMPVDNLTSILIFVGYSIPGFALGGVLLTYLGANYQLFPLYGFTGENYADLSLWGKVKDLLHHTFLPMICYVIGSFAVTTMMMKNNLMDNMAADYVRTAVAKGVSFNRAVFGHALRNSLIPIAATLGQFITVIVAGSMLIEKVFDIQGFGLLQLQAVIDRDQTVIMGTLTIAAFLLIIGNILSDFILSQVDPRIQFK